MTEEELRLRIRQLLRQMPKVSVKEIALELGVHEFTVAKTVTCTKRVTPCDSK